MNNLDGSNRLSRRLRLACAATKWLALVSAAGIAFAVFAGNAADAAVQAAWESLESDIRAAVSYSDQKKILLRIVAGAGSASPVLVILGAAAVFSVLEKGVVFSPRIAGRIRLFAATVLVSAMIALLAPTLLILIMTFDNPPQLRTLTLTVGSGVITSLLIGIFLFAMAQVMTMATQIDSENRQFV